jgi:transcriptional regulator with XRE-family HTH domain
MNTPWERLKSERERLGLSQSAFAEIGGVQKRTQINYEHGNRKPDTKYLEGIAAAGADVAYILTGTPKGLREVLEDVRHSTDLAGALGGSKKEILENQSALFDGMRKARTESAEEETLLKNYRRCAPMDQGVIRQMAARFAGDAATKPIKKKAPKT